VGPLAGVRSSISVGSIEPQFFAELLRGLGLDRAEVTSQFDLAHQGQTREIFAARFATKTRTQWSEIFAGSDASVTPFFPHPDRR
jgi:alpha-methylacyl-CoA racemase